MKFNKIFERYLLIGGVNTICTFFISLGIYTILEKKIGIIYSGIIANIVCIKFSFWMQRLFVFRSKNSWAHEYIKSNISYGILSVFSILLMYVMVKKLSIEIWIGQIILIPITVLLSYTINFKYTFRVK